ncbi:unnamed protein product [Rotaria sordida]|nr:unnamed protein product [Rotaria sordida]
MKLVFTVCLLTVIYQSSHLAKSSKSEGKSIKFSYLQILREKRLVNEKRIARYNDIVGVSSSNVIGYSNGNDSFISNEDNYLYGIYMGIKWQCVEYARRWTFLRKSSIFESVNGANDMWNQLKYIENVVEKKKYPLKKHSNGHRNRPINESYLIYPIQKDMPYGHVAIIVDVLTNSIRVAEQNFYFHYWKGNYSREIPILFKNGLYYIEDKYQVYGWIEINDNKQLKPLDKLTIETIEKKNKFFLNSASYYQKSNFIFFTLFIYNLMLFQYLHL